MRAISVNTLLHPIQSTLFRRFVFLVVLLPLLNFISCVENGLVDENPVQTISYEFADLENSTVMRVNQYRAGMSPPRSQLLTHNAIIAEAQKHSQNMATGKIPAGHEGMDERFASIRLVLSLLSAGENVAWLSFGYLDPVRAAYEGWLGSPGHKATIERDDWTHTGVGVAKSTKGEYYFTQIFVEVTIAGLWNYEWGAGGSGTRVGTMDVYENSGVVSGYIIYAGDKYNTVGTFGEASLSFSIQFGSAYRITATVSSDRRKMNGTLFTNPGQYPFTGTKQ